MATPDFPPRDEILRPFSVREDVLVLTPGPSNSAPRVLHVSSHQLPPLKIIFAGIIHNYYWDELILRYYRRIRVPNSERDTVTT